MKRVLLSGGIIASVLWTGSNVNAEVNQETKQFANKIENLPKGSITNPAFRGQIEEMVNKFISNKHKDTKLERMAIFQMPSGRAEIAASSPDGETLVVTEADLGQISILSIENLQDIQLKGTVSLKGIHPEAEVTSATITPDGKYAFVAFRTGDNLYNANKGKIAVVELSSKNIVKTYEVGVGPDSIALSKDGTKLVVCNEDEEGDPNDGNEVNMKKMKRPGTISSITFPSGECCDRNDTRKSYYGRCC